MSAQKKPLKLKQIKAELNKEFLFLQNVFSVLSIPQQAKDVESDVDDEILNDSSNYDPDKELPKRVNGIAELEQRLAKIKSQNNFNLKNKLAKKSLASKLNKKIKKKERLNKTRVKPVVDKPAHVKKEETVENINPTPIFNTDAKLVFSKFDFANTGKKERGNKVEKDPKKILENLHQQEERFKQLEENENKSKVKELKNKMAWKTMLQKAEGQKIKDDPTLLMKSIKKMDQKKKQSKKQWDNRLESVKQTKDARQVKRKENIAKKNKEKKSKKVKAAVKRGRVVI